MGQDRPGSRWVAAISVMAVAFAVGTAGEAQAQAASSLNFSNVPLSPSLFQQPVPAPLAPDPGGSFTAQTVTMPVPPLARTTLPSTGGADAADNQVQAEHEDGPSHAALDDRALAGVH